MVPTALYRHFDKLGRLLYVGIALSPIYRLSQHRGSHWVEEIRRVMLEWHPTRESALAAELAAIRNERPLHNVVGSTREPQRLRKPRLIPAVGSPWYCAVDGEVSGGIGATPAEAYANWLAWEEQGFHQQTQTAAFANLSVAVFGSLFDPAAEDWRRIEARDDRPSSEIRAA